MKSRLLLPALVAVGLVWSATASSASAFELLNRTFFGGAYLGGCGCDVAPTCGCEKSCKTRCRPERCHHHNRCCRPDRCAPKCGVEVTCAAPAPKCGCEADPCARKCREPRCCREKCPREPRCCKTRTRCEPKCGAEPTCAAPAPKCGCGA
jgi:hypothetical protein